MGKLNEAIAEFNNKAFVKLGSRSPKDAVDKIPKIIPLLKEQLKKFPSTNAGEFLAMRYALMEAMAVLSAEEAFSIFSYSSRIISDFQRDLKYHSGEWNQCLVVREFCPIPLQGELTALSQYYTNCYFPWLVENKEAVVSSVKLFHEALAQRIPKIESYVIDLVVHEDVEQAKHKESGVSLVELNPWTDKTGSALFSYKDEKDKEILEGGPFTFRVVESEPKIKVGGSWQTLIDQAKASDTRILESEAKCTIC